jgi:hypothetical protein
MYSKPWPGRGDDSCCVETCKPWSILDPSTSAPADYCFLLHRWLHHAPACIDFPALRITWSSSFQTWNTSCRSRGGVEEHMAADRLHRAMATVFETCSSVLEGWKNAGADAYKPFASRNTEHPWIALHAWSSIRTSTKSNPTRGTHPHASVMASISVPMALALVTWRCWPSTAASSGLRATCQLHAALITTIDSALHD